MIQETTHDLRIIYNLSQDMLNRTRMDGVLISINDDSIRIPKHIGMPHGENKIEGWGPFYLSNEITSMDLATIELYSGKNEITSFEAEITIGY